MAKKSKVPRPPQVKAPMRRTDSAKGSLLAGMPRWAWVAGAVAAVAVVAIVAITVSGGKSSGTGGEASVAATMRAAGCTYRDVKPFAPKKDPAGQNGGFHEDVPTLSTPTKGLWSTFPPSGGAHYGLWAVWGFYRQPVNPRQVVHNEEHGGVIIWWGPGVSAATIDQLDAFYSQKAEGMFGTPIAGLDSKIALTAWTGDSKHVYYQDGYYGTGHIAICKRFDQKAFAAFRDAYRGKGPEGIALSLDAPGSGPQ